ncbi:hypothetical protein L3X38_024051 [Prunus dulcis]|uniref:Uncharacterized protein n=1 Tax=Prunus dulcis TaxID=3755 RepID=A0AAD4W0P2_PRUDU|nr:hypothetical protein L3X38_024051 [Prunus dulcis]
MEETFFHINTSYGHLENRMVFQNFKNFMVGSHRVCCYEPARKFVGHLKRASQRMLRASVSTNRPSSKVKGCGIHLISHQDAAQFAQNLSQTGSQHMDSNFSQHCKDIMDEAMRLESFGDMTELEYPLG